MTAVLRQDAVKALHIFPIRAADGQLSFFAAHRREKGIHTALAAVRHGKGDNLRFRPAAPDLPGHNFTDFLTGHGSLEGIGYKQYFLHGSSLCRR